MNIEKQVCSYAQAEKLHSLGIVKHSVFYWHKDFDRPVVGNTDLPRAYSSDSYTQVCNDKDNAMSAFTSAELGVMLPDGINIAKVDGLWGIELMPDYLYVLTESTEAYARAEYLIQLLFNKIVSVEEVNARINTENES